MSNYKVGDKVKVRPDYTPCVLKKDVIYTVERVSRGGRGQQQIEVGGHGPYYTEFFVPAHGASSPGFNLGDQEE
jgi:hypothetical protein